jgi:hypothetical protein
MSDFAFTGRPNYTSPSNSAPDNANQGNWRDKLSDVPTWMRDIGGYGVTAAAGVLGGPLAAMGTNKILTNAGMYNRPNPTNSGLVKAENFARNYFPMFRPIDDAVRGVWDWTHPEQVQARKGLEELRKTLPYGNGMDMADPEYLRNMQNNQQNNDLAKAMADKGIGTITPYAFTRGQ